MNTISNTAFYCCGVRADDARREDSICQDTFAARFMDAQAQAAFAPFLSETMPNISNATRCRIIDDFLRAELAPGTTVVSIGAGLDTRPYRIDGGTWVEVDELPLITYKEEILPTGECPSPLRRIAIDFSRDSLAEVLAGTRGTVRTIVVVEGVFMYLDPDAINGTLDALRRVYPAHTLLCDLMNRRFFEKFSARVHEKLSAMGGTFTPRPERPADIFLKGGYIEEECVPTCRRALELGVYRRRLGLPDWVGRLLLNRLMRDLNGYAVYRFRFG